MAPNRRDYLAIVLFLERPGTRLHYEITGQGPTILLTHGFAASSAMFAGNLPTLAKHHQVITWDLPGHAASDYPTEPALYEPAAATAHMAALLDHAGADTAIVGGHSVGGYLSLEFALTYPDRLAALILIDTGPGYRKDSSRVGWNAMAERYALGLSTQGLAAIPAGDELAATAHRDASGLVLAARGYLSQRDGHVMEGLRTIAVPTLVIVGADDAAFLAGSEYMARTIPAANLVIIPDAGHAPNLSQPAAFEAAIAHFLGALG